MKGSPQAVIERCTTLCWDGVERSFRRDDIAQVVAANDAMAARWSPCPPPWRGNESTLPTPTRTRPSVVWNCSDSSRLSDPPDPRS